MKELLPTENLREEIKEKVIKTFSEFIESDSNTTVSEAQIAAYKEVVEEIPEGKLKEFAEGVQSIQERSSKLNQAIIAIQDKTWQLARAVVIARLPLAALIPENPFSKIAIKSASLGGWVNKNIVKLGRLGGEKIKSLRKK